MSDALAISNALLWIGLIVLGFVVMALTRQIGLLHERLGPAGALAQERGPKVGDAIPRLEFPDMMGTPVELGGESPGVRTLLFFLSPNCPICESLLPTLLKVAQDEDPGLRLILASDGEPDEHREFRARKGLEDQAYVLSLELGLKFAVSKLPTAILLDEQGIVRAKGLVNSREHLESLFNAHELGAGSIQEFMAQENPAPNPIVQVEAHR